MEWVASSCAARAASRPARFVGLATCLIVALLALMASEASSAGANAGPPPVTILTKGQLDAGTRVATLVASYKQPEGLSATSQGKVQATDEGNLFVGWGALPYFSAFDPTGKLIFNAKFPQGVYSYRAYFLPFSPAN